MKDISELQAEISRIKINYPLQKDVRFTEEMVPRYQKKDGSWTKSFFIIKYDETAPKGPLMLDCDNHLEMNPYDYTCRVNELIDHLKQLGFTVYAWKTSIHKTYHGFHVITDELLTWKEASNLIDKLDETFADVLDTNHSKSIKGEVVIFKSGDVAKDSGIRSQATRVSPKLREGELPINDMSMYYGQVTTSSSLHVQMKHYSYALYVQLLHESNAIHNSFVGE